MAAARHPSLILTRSLSTTPHLSAKSASSRLAYLHRAVPPYPHGPSHVYKQSNFGLYGGLRIQFGNKVSGEDNKSRRRWRPNIRSKHLYSQALGRWLKVKVTARVLRTIDKCGGLDEYLLGDKSARIKELGMGGWRLRWRVMQTEVVRKRFEEERRSLGLLGESTMEGGVLADGRMVGGEELQREISAFDEELERGRGLAVGEETEEEAVTSSREEQFMEEKKLPGSRPTL